MEEKKIVLKIENVGKVYGTNRVLENINLEFQSGEIIGLIGENGAGKSTLLKIICGVTEPTEGSLTYIGQPYLPKSIIQANQQGVGMVFQEQSMVGNLSVAQNIFLGREKLFKKHGVVSWREMNIKAKEALAQIGVDDINPKTKARELNFASRQMVEIAKVFNAVQKQDGSPSLVLLDEPTTVLSDSEIQKLFKEMRRMAALGHAIVFISHRLDEVIEISDRIYVLKDGRNSGMLMKEEMSEEVLYESMVGRATTGEYYREACQTVPEKEVVLECRNLSKFGMFKNYSFKLYKGEVLGLAGVEGSGKEDVCACICGDDEADSGEIYLFGKKVSFSSPCAALKNGIISVPKERRDEGLIETLSVYDNMIMSNYKKVTVNGIISNKKIREDSNYWLKTMGVKARSIDDKMNELSGGNAQKVVFARTIYADPKILILNHPTRGVDIGAKEEIYQIVRDITKSGVSVILIGDTLDECIGLSSRLIVMKDGLISGEFDCPVGNKPSQVDVVQKMM